MLNWIKKFVQSKINIIFLFFTFLCDTFNKHVLGKKENQARYGNIERIKDGKIISPYNLSTLKGHLKYINRH